MARDYAQIRSDIWADDHWRTLTPGAQWLYTHLLTSPKLTHAGVTDWRPGRIAKLARTLSADGVRKYADELMRERFVLTDDETEEIVVRSFIRHDGVLLNPNLWKSLGSAFADIYSAPIKAMVAHEVLRLRDEHPEGISTPKGRTVNPWSSHHLQTLLKSGSDRGSDTPIYTPSPMGSDTGSPPTPLPTPTPEASLPTSEARKKETKLPNDWAPTSDHIKRAKDLGVDVLDAAENFRLHAETHDRRAASWNGAFTTWLKKTPPAIGAGGVAEDMRDGFLFRKGKPTRGGPHGMNREQYDAWEEAQLANRRSG